MDPQNHRRVPANAPQIQRLAYSVDTGMGCRARIGLLVLQTDQTIEGEFRRLLPADGVSIYHARLANDAIVTPDTLKRMEAELPTAAALLPSEFGFSSIGYGCTSGSTMIGQERVAQIMGESHPGVPVSDPLCAAKSALQALAVRKIALLTPYSPEVTEAMQANLYASGLDVSVVGSFYEDNDAVVGRIDEESIAKAAIAIGESSDCEGVFISCTSLRVANIVNEIEGVLNKPVTASNHALAWHLFRLAGLNEKIENQGQLFNQLLRA